MQTRLDSARLWIYVRPYLKSLILAAALLSATAAINLTLLWILRNAFNDIIVDRSTAALSAKVLTLFFLLLIQSVLSMGHNYLITWIGQRVVTDFRCTLFEHLQRLSLSFFAKRRTGELISRFTNDVGIIQNMIVNVPVDTIKQAVTLLGGIAILFYVNWRLCLMVLTVLPLIALTARYFGKKLRRLSTQIQDQLADSSTVLEEVISGIRMVKSFVREGYELNRFSRQIERVLDITMQKTKVLAVFVPVITFLTMGAAAGVLWYGGNQVIQGHITPGDLFAFALYAGLMIGPFGSFARLFSQIKEAQGATQRVFEILDMQPLILDQPDAKPMPAIHGQVAFHNVSFAYDPTIPVLRNISFEVSPGQAVALVGPSGSGKTTLANLLHRFYDPTTGSIEIDGKDIKRVQLMSLYSQIALVPQETILFGGTVRENILYGRIEAGEADMIAAAKAANAHDFITAFPGGYDTIVGEKGINLSGGQRQRLAIARAILKNPRLLILDEATSSLDNESEKLVQEALDRLMENRTSFIIAHRLTTIQHADRILVLDKGRLAEEGTHTELLGRKGLDHHLYTMKLAGVEV
jgi:subfamily B ATP-binding cassette protein MsbA